MSKTITQDALTKMHKLIADPDFSFIERKQVQTSLLELNLHKETGICNILAWLFNAKEGHLQGECFLKALINGVYQTASDKHLQHIPSPTKMLTLSLSQFTIMTEVSIQQSKDRRIDILMVDVNSKTVIVFERKDGSSAYDGQLKDYFEWTENQYKDWDKIYVLSDSFNKEHGEEFHPSFIQLDDTWLTTLLLDLIQREGLTERSEYIFRDLHDFVFASWDEKRDPFYQGLNKRVEQLAHNHFDFTKDLSNFQIIINGKLEKIMSISQKYYFTHLCLLENDLCDLEYQFLMLIHSHYDAIDLLRDYTGFEFFAGEIKERFPLLKEDVRDNKLSLINKKHGLFDNDYWPYALHIRRITSEEENIFRIYISANKNCNEQEIPIAEKFSKLNDFKVKSNWKYKELMVLDNVTSLSLNGDLLTEIDSFYQNSKRL